MRPRRTDRKEGTHMAYDAGMLACCIHEIAGLSLGARVEKVFQPEKDEIVLQMRSQEGGKRLLINAGSAAPRLCFTEAQKENPTVPPMLCMLLRKHLQGAKLTDIRQAGFERVAILTFEGRDEMGFPCRRKLIAEIMGKFSNLIFADENDKILSVLYPVDFSTSARRQLLPGMTYELPPSQNKRSPLEETSEGFGAAAAAADPTQPADRFLTATYCGIAPAVARELVLRAAGRTDAPIGTSAAALSPQFLSVMADIRAGRFSPSSVTDRGKPVEYAYIRLEQYGSGMTVTDYERPGALLDAFFGARDREQHIRQRAQDILHILTNADTRIRKKLELQRAELADCEMGAAWKQQADLITANLHAIPNGARSAELTDYADWHEDGTYGTVSVSLDPRLSPAANAQRLYKRYNKSKNAKVELTRQIALGESELTYLDTVFDALTHAETAADLTEIRDELYRSGYASKMKQYKLTPARKKQTPEVLWFRTSGGFRVACGKNNLQNEYITHTLAGKTDYWFHIKGMAGSHVVLFCEGKEPDVRDFTEAAEIAAYYSKGAKGGGSPVEVDYTLAKNVKKPAGAKPGFVIYHTNWSCVVTPKKPEGN